ncbi:hypothetical protein NM688_g1610 [Phlebia brevispora]|uniref:Uncharacterized protein n=1 Tax=Phlebia brevispora TaxID=194682 RepID=A0ACC1TBB0_9APHY|nr:hypothetical protein NM688_g1610 [Phlebia brevispora]
MLWVPACPAGFSRVLKVPILLSSAYYVHLASTPPNPPAKKSETAKYAGHRDALSIPKLWPYTTGISKAVYWINAIAESAIIIGSTYPSLLSPSLLRLLVHEPYRNVSDIRLTPVWLAGSALMIMGSLIRLSCYHTLGRFFTWDLAIEDNHKLITSGPYAVVRHPGYVGNTMIGLGTILCHLGAGSWFVSYGGLESFAGKLFAAAWSFMVLYVPATLLRRVNTEDEVLRREFGEEWEAYARETPYKLIPYVY